MSNQHQFSIAKSDDDIRLDRWFKRHYPQVPVSAIQKAIRKGLIRLDGVKVKQVSAHVMAGQELHIKFMDLAAAGNAKPAKTVKALSDNEIQETQSWVLFKNDHVIAINKPAGIAVQGGSGVKDHVDRRLDALMFGYEERPKLVHRLDKDTSGVLLLARSAKAATALVNLFASKRTQKTYLAMIIGVPEIRSGEIEGDVMKQGDEQHYEKMQVVESGEGQQATTAYDVKEALGSRLSYVSLQPITGRTHQLRVHMAQMGHPILGDGKYGGKEAFVDGMDLPKQLHLHAHHIRVHNLFGESIDVTAPFPPHMKITFKKLGIKP